MRMEKTIALFEAYLDQLQGRMDQAQTKIEQSMTNLLEKESLPEVATWLWLLEGQVARSQDKQLVGPFLEKYHDHIEQCITLLTNSWDQPSRNVWGDDPQMVHISNLGIIYGSLQAAKRLTGKREIQQTLTAIRDYVFDNGLSSGMLIRSPEKKEVSTDLLSIVMPFGLFSPEDLVMVEAVKEMEGRLVTSKNVFRYRGATYHSPASAAWLAWYFTEKGDLRKASYYMKLSENTQYETQGITDQQKEDQELACILLKIVYFYMDQIVQSNGDMQIIHTPVGNDNRYEFLRTERIPREPEVDQDVRVRAQVWPEQDVEVVVKVEKSGCQFEVKCSPVEIDGETVWEASIGSFAFDDDVSYRFVARRGNDETKGFKEGTTFSFSPFTMNQLETIEFSQQIEDIFWFKGQDRLKLNTTFLGISSNGEGLNVQVKFNEEEKESMIDTSASLTYSVVGNTITLTSDSLVCQLDKSPFQFRVTDSDGQQLLEGYDQFFSVLQWRVNRLGQISKASWNFKTPLDERFYGLGERFNRLEQRGDSLDCYVYNQYKDQGNRTYIPVPFYMSSKGYGMFLETLFYSEFSFGSQFSDLLSISCEVDVNQPAVKLQLFPGQPKEISQQFASVTGKPVLPPVWSFGPWMSSNNWDRDSIVRKQVQETNKYQIPSTVLVLEQWSDEATYYIFNDAEYELTSGDQAKNYGDYHFPDWGRWPDPKGLFDYLHENGLKVILWQIPVHKYLNRQDHPQKDADEQYMLEQGYAVKKADGTSFRMPEGWFKESLLMDYSHEQGREWWFEKRKYLLEIGVDGFKTDGGEFVFGNDLMFADGRTGAQMRNLYPNDYIEAYYKFATEYHQGDALTFSRAGYTGAQNFPAHWAGDESSTFAAFRHSLIAGLTSGISGIPFWGWDLAGFNGDIPTVELFVRSAQMAAFCPIMQYHAESKAESNQDRTPWNIAERTGDDRALEGYRFYANVRMNLLPYILDQAQHTNETGIPLMRALFMEYPEDPRCHAIYDQYMFGDHLLIAPVIEEGDTERMVYFPQGEWVDLWSNEVVAGPVWKRVKAPLMSIPVFVKVGAVLLSNCDETLKLGSWVGNSVDQYQVPVLRVYLEAGMEQRIRDHLDQEWMVRVANEEGQWDLEIQGQENALVMVPLSLVGQGKTMVINGKKNLLEECAIKDNSYVISVQ